MTALPWQPLAPGEDRKWVEALRQAHNALQWLVRIAHSYCPPEADNAHVLLTFEPERGAFRTRTFLDKYALELRLPALEMQFTENGQPMRHVLDMEERSSAKVEAWILVELLHRHIDRDRFSKALPYPFPNLMSGDAEDYAPKLLHAELEVLMAWLRNGAAVANLVADAAGATGAAKGKFTCWPQAFTVGRDIAPAVGGRCRVGLTAGSGTEVFFFVARLDGVATQPRFRVPMSRVIAQRLGPSAVADELLAAMSDKTMSTA